MRPQAILGDAFFQWLDERARNNLLPRALPLDVFASSLRRSGLIAPHLHAIATGQPLSTNDPVQAMGDLRAMALVSSEKALTPFGHAVNDAWARYNVASTSDGDDEVVRCVILVVVALELGISLHEEAFESWCRLASLAPASFWIKGSSTEERWALSAAMHLDAEDSRGYNPLDMLAAASQSEPIPPLAEWSDWAAELIDRAASLDAGVAALANIPGESSHEENLRSQAQNLRRNADLIGMLFHRNRGFRVGGVAPLCKAMELVRLRRGCDQEAFQTQLLHWLPDVAVTLDTNGD